ncbi:uncharacterized protein NP_7040A (plasmid) [Natronomonas pharaonis DSM 2160]|uniref:Uncharacterized protein n=1 Tax=Natronomonas pharaonis (strain ATCC 35678 / DSM 2160 / CIP 103997 / JCM 8858 / NBRC 14720 / NCIMB 2260 / Gabara) TaxID=348780 RepID=Q3ILT4_NATPD|nr:hypothetical protein [Natronomonas pharaonis]CAI49749.1 uncharacterized protein NP_3316A [Natronomonas pharaonis DSM 2160]CAI50936.1 uncharacterized protein NP_7040A [Natronomonas pharaonis DSM 2160]
MTTPDSPELEDSSLACFGQGTEGDLVECVTTDLSAAAGGTTMMGLLIGGTLLLSLYIAGDGDPAVPTVVTILVGGTLVPMLPPHLTPFAYSIVVLGIAFGGMAAAQRWLLRGGF